MTPKKTTGLLVLLAAAIGGGIYYFKTRDDDPADPDPNNPGGGGGNPGTDPNFYQLKYLNRTDTGSAYNFLTEREAYIDAANKRGKLYETITSINSLPSGTRFKAIPAQYNNDGNTYLIITSPTDPDLWIPIFLKSAKEVNTTISVTADLSQGGDGGWKVMSDAEAKKFLDMANNPKSVTVNGLSGGIPLLMN